MVNVVVLLPRGLVFSQQVIASRVLSAYVHEVSTEVVLQLLLLEGLAKLVDATAHEAKRTVVGLGLDRLAVASSTKVSLLDSIPPHEHSLLAVDELLAQSAVLSPGPGL